MSDLTIGPPGIPDPGTFADDEPASSQAAGGGTARATGPGATWADEGQPAAGPANLPTVQGLVRAAAGIASQLIGAAYPERPGIGAMTDEETEGIALALASWSTRNPGLAAALERGDALTVAFYLAGWAGRTTTDIAAVRRERDTSEHHREAEVDRHGAAQGGGGGEQGLGVVGAPGGGGPHRGVLA